jgi:site-specific recombinase XerD
MLGVCKNDEQRGLVTVLDLTGMHVSSVCSLGPANLIRRGSKTYLTWVRPKTNKTLEALVPSDRIHTIENFLKMRRKTRQFYHYLVKNIGISAGYDNISPMTFRHNLCVRTLTQSEDLSLFMVPQVMGCSLDVVVRNYSKLHEDDIARAREGGSIFKRRKGFGGFLHFNR